MKHRDWQVRPWQVALVWAVVLFPLTFWGLPSKRHDAILLGESGVLPLEAMDAARKARALRERNAGADVDADPIRQRDVIVDLTVSPAMRGEILTRFRLFSNQPDEMITFRALQRMSPRSLDLDPKLTQYGGAWIYLVGAALGAAHLVGLARITSDINVYLESPELFGRFYVIARCITLVFAAAALVAVHQIAKRASSATGGWVAMALFACSPVFVSGALEAKPHIPAACLTLFATIAALEFAAKGRLSDAMWLGALAGGAAGFVLTGFAAFLLWPALLIAYPVTRRAPAARRLVLAGLVAVGVYLSTNPYVPYNLLFNREALFSNLNNSTAMYTVARPIAGLIRVNELLVESAGWLVPVGGLIAAAFCARRAPRETVLASAVALGFVLLCTAIGAGKPAEFARFLVIPVAMLCVAVGIAIGRVSWNPRGRVVAAVAVCTVIPAATMKTANYVRSFRLDSAGIDDTRSRAAVELAAREIPGQTIGLTQEPAPYSVPPLDFVNGRVVLLPREAPPEGPAALPDWVVLTDDDASGRRLELAWWRRHYDKLEYAANSTDSPITWANKPVLMYVRRASIDP